MAAEDDVRDEFRLDGVVFDPACLVRSKGAFEAFIDRQIAAFADKRRAGFPFVRYDFRRRVRGDRTVARDIEDDGIRILFLDSNGPLRKVDVRHLVLAVHHAVSRSFRQDRTFRRMDQVDALTGVKLSRIFDSRPDGRAGNVCCVRDFEHRFPGRRTGGYVEIECLEIFQILHGDIFNVEIEAVAAAFCRAVSAVEAGSRRNRAALNCDGIIQRASICRVAAVNIVIDRACVQRDAVSFSITRPHDGTAVCLAGHSTAVQGDFISFSRSCHGCLDLRELGLDGSHARLLILITQIRIAVNFFDGLFRRLQQRRVDLLDAAVHIAVCLGVILDGDNIF